uniref:Uncharacterized protein n=1 Tax=Romanomermis culicivorax TaxID=13658 RepID=A0A915JKH4_ROMCU
MVCSLSTRENSAVQSGERLENKNPALPVCELNVSWVARCRRVGWHRHERARYLTYDTLGAQLMERSGGKRVILEWNREKNVALLAIQKEETRYRETVAWAAMSL